MLQFWLSFVQFAHFFLNCCESLQFSVSFVNYLLLVVAIYLGVKCQYACALNGANLFACSSLLGSVVV